MFDENQSLDFGDDIHNDLIIGGEIISPTARLDGEISNKEAIKRGWLQAITSAANKAKESTDVSDLLTIVKACLEKNILTTEEINSHLMAINFNAETIKKEQLNEEQINAILAEITAQISKVKDRSLTLDSFLNFVKESIARGLPKERLKEILEANDVEVIDKEVIKQPKNNDQLEIGQKKP